jgi:hypothetical protein
MCGLVFFESAQFFLIAQECTFSAALLPKNSGSRLRVLGPGVRVTAWGCGGVGAKGMKIYSQQIPEVSGNPAVAAEAEWLRRMRALKLQLHHRRLRWGRLQTAAGAAAGRGGLQAAASGAAAGCDVARGGRMGVGAADRAADCCCRTVAQPPVAGCCTGSVATHTATTTKDVASARAAVVDQ